MDTNSPPRLIAFTGYAQSGKGTATSLLTDRYGYQELAFANPLREAAQRINPIVGLTRSGRLIRYNESVDKYGYTKAKQLYPEIRNFLQKLGTDFGRNMIDNDIWVELAMERIRSDQKVVISDLRFDNELRAVRDRGGIIVRINRHDSNDEHPSEKNISTLEVDHEINNDGTIHELWRNIEKILKLY